jgi:hypothetical protein
MTKKTETDEVEQETLPIEAESPNTVGGVQTHFDEPALTFAQRVALDPSIDIERLKAVIEMEEASQDRAAEKAFNAAFAAMQPELPAVTKSGENLHLKSSYSKLEDIQAAVRPILQKHGFSYRWSNETIDGQIHVTCHLAHEGGHSISDTLPLPVIEQKGTNALQQRGITMSYGKRYTFCNVTGIQLGGEYTDGATPLSGDTLKPDQVKTIQFLLKKLDRKEEAFLQWMGSTGVIVATELENVPVESFEEMQNALAQLAAKQGAA